LLNLAHLHSRFGHTQEALYSVKEAIDVARENQDQDALNFALQ